MSEIDTNPEVVETPDELTALKARADLLGIRYHPSISLEKLRDKVNAAVTATSTADDDADEEPAVKPKAKPDLGELRRQASELVRIRVSCMNPLKKEWEGEIFTVGNSGVGTFKKYVPFNADEGWHVPRIIYEHLKGRECQVFVSVRDNKGNTTRKGKMIKEFAIEVLPQLTKEELHDLAQRQAMAKAID